MIDINSQEFERAWFMVAQALLEDMRRRSGGVAAPVSAPAPATVPAPTATPTVAAAAPAAAAPAGQSETFYASGPVGGTTFKFKNLKREKDEDSRYVIQRYPDGTCTFELCQFDKQYYSQFMVAITSNMPASVGEYTGMLTPDGGIKNITPGTGQGDARSVVIKSPLKVEFS